MARYDPKTLVAECVLDISEIFSYNWNTQWNEYVSPIGAYDVILFLSRVNGSF